MAKKSKKPPKSPFNRKSTAEEVTEELNLRGKTALVTGCNSGLGFETMRVLTMRGAHVIGAARTQQKAAEACEMMAGQTSPVECELSDFDSVVACTEQVAGMGIPIDMLICNAGIMALPDLEQKYGLELQFVTNHLGHFILVNRLLDQVNKSNEGRVVMLSSAAHQQGPKDGIQFDNLSGEDGYSGWSAYGQSKLANILFANHLSKRLENTTTTSNSVHPGVINTNLGRNMKGPMLALLSVFVLPFIRSIPQGAATQCYVATNPSLRGVSGYYFADCNAKKTSAHGRDADMAEKLWNVSEELTAKYLG